MLTFLYRPFVEQISHHFFVIDHENFCFTLFVSKTVLLGVNYLSKMCIHTDPPSSSTIIQY
jgi:hypothetical protein